MADTPRQKAAYLREYQDITRPYRSPGNSSGISPVEMDAILKKLNDVLRDLFTKIYGRIDMLNLNGYTQEIISNKLTEAGLSTWIQQNPGAITAIIQEAGYIQRDEYTQDKQTTETQINAVAGEVSMNFITQNELITNIDGELKAQIETLEKYIRFQNGDIILGEVGNDIILHIENDRIAYIYAGDVATYFTDKKIVITNEGSNQRIELGIETDDPFIRIYDSNNQLAYELNQSGMTLSNSSKIRPYTIASKNGIGFFV